MAFEIPGFSFTLIAAADLSTTGQYRFVTVDSAGKAAITGAGVARDGVLQNKPQAGEAGTIMVNGVSIVETGAAVTAGQLVMSDASGRAITRTATNAVCGRALESSTGVGVRIAVLLDSNTPVAP